MEAFKIQMLITLAFFIIIWLGFNKTWLNSLAMAAACAFLTAFILSELLEIGQLTKPTTNITNNTYQLGNKTEDGK